jgi:hypothetical protein
MGTPERAVAQPAGIGAILASSDDGTLTGDPHLRQGDGKAVAAIRQPAAVCPKISHNAENLRQKSHRRLPALRDSDLSSGITADFGDNAINGIVAFRAQSWRRARKTFDRKCTCRR